jgi:hypothetical protein
VQHCEVTVAATPFADQIHHSVGPLALHSNEGGAYLVACSCAVVGTGPVAPQARDIAVVAVSLVVELIAGLHLVAAEAHVQQQEVYMPLYH